MGRLRGAFGGCRWSTHLRGIFDLDEDIIGIQLGYRDVLENDLLALHTSVSSHLPIVELNTHLVGDDQSSHGGRNASHGDFRRISRVVVDSPVILL